MDRGPGYDSATYGDTVADFYDLLYGADEAAVACLTGLAGAGPVLELAIGTGRLALPLAARGLEVHGIDASEAMIERLRAKPGGAAIPVTVGDFADVGVDGEFALVFVAFSTFFALTGAEQQARCFANAASHLAPAGRFVIEAFVPDPTRFVRNHHLEVAFRPSGILSNVSRHDAPTQRVESLCMWVSGDAVPTWPVRLRYSYPKELDSMAADAGLMLEHRWSSWKHAPFTTDSGRHVSVYALA